MSNENQDFPDTRGKRSEDQSTRQQPSNQPSSQGDNIPTLKDFEDVNYRSGFRHIGKVMIINNVDYKQHDFIRKKSDHDCAQLKEVFEKLGFKGVITRQKRNEPEIVFKNITKSKLKELLEDASNDNMNDYTDYYCFLCVVLSLGEVGVVECVADENSRLSSKYEISEMQEFFKGHKCGTLKMKPKLFFIQVDSLTKTDKMDDSSVPRTKNQDIIVKKIPREADILTHLCNIPDLPDENAMSFYPRALKEAFEKYVWNKDPPMELNKLLIRVNGLFKQYLGNSGITPDKKVQIPVVTTLLTKHMYFNKSIN